MLYSFSEILTHSQDCSLNVAVHLSHRVCMFVCEAMVKVQYEYRKMSIIQM